jgi:signal transduction histidine kinase
MTTIAGSAGIAVSCAIAVATVASLLVRRFVGASMAAWQAAAVGVAVLTTAAGVTGVAQARYLTGHDLAVVLLVMVVCGPVAGGAAVWLARPLAHDAATLRAAARDLGQPSFRPAARPPIAELADLAGELAATDTRLKECAERDAALSDSRRELLAWVSHDLRAPLADIRAMTEALEDSLIDDAATVARWHSRMRAEVDRLAATADDLFELTRVPSGEPRLSLTQASLANLVSEAVLAADPVARASGVRVTGAESRSKPLEVDVGEIGRVLTDLLVKAIRQTPGDGTVEAFGNLA